MLHATRMECAKSAIHNTHLNNYTLLCMQVIKVARSLRWPALQTLFNIGL